MATVSLEGRTIVIESERPRDIDVAQVALASAMAASVWIESWEVEHGAEMSPDMMEFAGAAFQAGFMTGLRGRELLS